jgi:methionine-rich copper-binding protein CopC
MLRIEKMQQPLEKGSYSLEWHIGEKGRMMTHVDGRRIFRAIVLAG